VEDAIEKVKISAKKAVDSHKHNFLHRFMEHSESQIEQIKRDKELF
jgi:hypothetical protein